MGKNIIAILRVESDVRKIDRYVGYLLNALSNHVNAIVIFCNKKADRTVLNSLRLDEVKLNVYNNDAITYANYCKTEIVPNFKEVLFLEDNFYGPLYPLTQLFSRMERRTEDFWGITCDYNNKEESDDEQHVVLSPYFLFLNERILKSKEFAVFLQGEKGETGFAARLIHTMEQKGFTWSSYVDESIVDKKGSLLLSYKAVKEYKCPFVEKRSLIHFDLSESFGENARNTMDYISQKTSYNIEMIWENLLRMYNIVDIKNSLHLEYIFPCSGEHENIKIFNEKKILILIHLYYEDLVEKCFEYIKGIPVNIDVYITTSELTTKEKIDDCIFIYQLKNCKSILKENRGRDISSLLVGTKHIISKYEYLCFIHDKKGAYLKSMTEGESWMDSLWENTIKNEVYIQKVIQCLIENTQLGFLSPPMPLHGVYLESFENPWMKNFHTTLKLANRLGLVCDIDKEKPPFALSSTFWCKTKAMKPLFMHDFKYEDFPEEPMASDGTISHAIERCFAFVAQNEGYYSGIMMNSNYASLQVSNLECILRKSLKIIWKDYAILDMEDLINCDEEIEQLLMFCKQFKNIFIYGIGNYGQRYGNVLLRHKQDFKGYLVSDDKECPYTILSHPVWKLSEVICSPNECGIILGLNRKNQKEVTPLLKQAGYVNVYKKTIK